MIDRTYYPESYRELIELVGDHEAAIVKNEIISRSDGLIDPVVCISINYDMYDKAFVEYTFVMEYEDAVDNINAGDNCQYYSVKDFMGE